MGCTLLLPLHLLLPSPQLLSLHLLLPSPLLLSLHLRCLHLCVSRPLGCATADSHAAEASQVEQHTNPISPGRDAAVAADMEEQDLGASVQQHDNPMREPAQDACVQQGMNPEPDQNCGAQLSILFTLAELWGC